MREVWIALCCSTAVQCVVHIAVHKLIPPEHRQSQEIVLMLLRVPLDGALLLVAVFVAAQEAWRGLLQRLQGRNGGHERRRLLRSVVWGRNIFVSILLLLILWRAMIIMGTSTIPHVQVSVLRGLTDPCEMEGLQLRPDMVSSWVLPAILPRRFYNFYVGSESCSPRGWHSFGFMDKEEEVLLLSPQCAGGAGKPRLFLHRPENSDLINPNETSLSEAKTVPREYHRYLESLFGDEEKARAAHVIVHRDAQTGHILGVEVDPAELTLEAREPRTAEEREARRWWPAGDSKTVLKYALGQTSSAYHVLCGSEEEYFVHPMPPPARWSEGPSEACPTAAPAGNVLILLFDAVSRQGTVRQLPKLVDWVRRFKKREDERRGRDVGKNNTGYVVREIEQTTLGMSTAGNVIPYFAGTSVFTRDQAGVDRSTLDFMNHSIFNIAKKKYGERIQTSFMNNFCSNMIDFMLFSPEKTSGVGIRFQGIDHYLVQPFCHAEYTARPSNFRGPYSIVPRCIDHRYVHSHALDYLEILMRRRLRALAHHREHRETCKPFFFDVGYFIEAHEGTQGVLHTVDAEMTAFLERLERLGFFEGESENALLIMSDHGSHMGPYYEFTSAGAYERTTPLMLYFVPAAMLERMDQHKGWKLGSSRENFELRASRLNTPLDTYWTLADMLSLDIAGLVEPYNTVDVPAASLFRPRPSNGDQYDGVAPVTKCKSFFNNNEPFPCLLDFCVPHA